MRTRVRGWSGVDASGSWVVRVSRGWRALGKRGGEGRGGWDWGGLWEGRWVMGRGRFVIRGMDEGAWMRLWSAAALDVYFSHVVALSCCNVSGSGGVCGDGILSVPLFMYFSFRCMKLVTVLQCIAKEYK